MRVNSLWGWLVAGLVLAGLVVWVVVGEGRHARLRATGLAASARVVAARQTGTWVNNNPEVALDLEVSVPGRAPYAATLKAVVPQLNLVAVQPGATLAVRVAPDDAGRLALDEPWAR